MIHFPRAQCPARPQPPCIQIPDVLFIFNLQHLVSPSIPRSVCFPLVLMQVEESQRLLMSRKFAPDLQQQQTSLVCLFSQRGSFTSNLETHMLTNFYSLKDDVTNLPPLEYRSIFMDV